MIIRPPEPEDNEDLIQLDRVAPEEGLVSYYVDRRPKYIRRPDAERFFPYVAEENGKAVGVIFSSLDELIVGGQKRVCDYISSLRVHPKYQKRGIGGALVDRAVEKGMSEGAEVFWAVVIGKNIPSYSTFSKCGFERVAGLGFRILTSSRRGGSSGVTLRKANEGDLDRMFDLVSSFYRNHNFQPADMKSWLRRRSKFGDDLLGGTYVAERDGRIVATVRANKHWETTRMIITKLSMGMKVYSGIFRLGIAEGSPLRMLDFGALSYAKGEEMAAVDLVRMARIEFRSESRVGFVQHGMGGVEETFLRRIKGFRGHSDVMAMGPGIGRGNLDPVFPSR